MRGFVEAELAERLKTPALVVSLDRARVNVERVLARLGGDADRWRPHVKTTKLRSVWELLCSRGVRCFKTATLRETERLCSLGRELGLSFDVLVAYPHRGPNLVRLGELAATYPDQRLSVLCEEAADLESVPGGLGVFVDVDPGMGRTGVPHTEPERAVAIGVAAGARLRGVHAYEGHEHGPEPERRERLFAWYGELLELVEHFERAGASIGEVVTSGTPGFEAAVEHPGLARLGAGRHRVSPGTVVFGDLRAFSQCPGLGLEPAAVVLARVVSRQGALRATCDAGSKALASEAGDPIAAALGWPGLVARIPSEEHLPLDAVRGDPPARGTLLELVPRHVCPTVNLAEQAVVVEEGRTPRVEAVFARAHDVRIR